VTNTRSLGSNYSLIRLIAPVGQTFGLIPQLSFFTSSELQQEMITAGFEIEKIWQPQPTAALFLIARKPL
jgi:hypothetical protein